jgi:hypothetical protein
MPCRVDLGKTFPVRPRPMSPAPRGVPVCPDRRHPVMPRSACPPCLNAPSHPRAARPGACSALLPIMRSRRPACVPTRRCRRIRISHAQAGMFNSATGRLARHVRAGWVVDQGERAALVWGALRSAPSAWPSSPRTVSYPPSPRCSWSGAHRRAGQHGGWLVPTQRRAWPDTPDRHPRRHLPGGAAGSHGRGLALRWAAWLFVTAALCQFAYRNPDDPATGQRSPHHRLPRRRFCHARRRPVGLAGRWRRSASSR